MATTPGTYAGGFLPSQYPEVANLPSAQQFLAELVDMQFEDLRVFCACPTRSSPRTSAAIFTAAAMLTNLISGFSVWFFHTPYARGRIEQREKKRGQGLSKAQLLGFVRAYFPRQLQEPTKETIAKHLYAARNVLGAQPGDRRLDVAHETEEELASSSDRVLEASGRLDGKRGSGAREVRVPAARGARDHAEGVRDADQHSAAVLGDRSSASTRADGRAGAV